MAKSTLRLVRPTTEKRTVTPRRRPNAELRTREHLTERVLNLDPIRRPAAAIGPIPSLGDDAFRPHHAQTASVQKANYVFVNAAVTKPVPKYFGKIRPRVPLPISCYNHAYRRLSPPASGVSRNGSAISVA